MIDIKPAESYTILPPERRCEVIPINPKTGYDTPPIPDGPRADTKPTEPNGRDQLPLEPGPNPPGYVPEPWPTGDTDPWPTGGIRLGYLPPGPLAAEGLPPGPYQPAMSESIPPGPHRAEVVPPGPMRFDL